MDCFNYNPLKKLKEYSQTRAYKLNVSRDQSLALFSHLYMEKKKFSYVLSY